MNAAQEKRDIQRSAKFILGCANAQKIKMTAKDLQLVLYGAYCTRIADSWDFSCYKDALFDGDILAHKGGWVEFPEIQAEYGKYGDAPIPTEEYNMAEYADADYNGVIGEAFSIFASTKPSDHPELIEMTSYELALDNGDGSPIDLDILRSVILESVAEDDDPDAEWDESFNEKWKEIAQDKKFDYLDEEINSEEYDD